MFNSKQNHLSLSGLSVRRILTANLLLYLLGSLIGFEILIKQLGVQIVQFFWPHQILEEQIFQCIILSLAVLGCLPLVMADSIHTLRYSYYFGFVATNLLILLLAAKTLLVLFNADLPNQEGSQLPALYAAFTELAFPERGDWTQVRGTVHTLTLTTLYCAALYCTSPKPAE